MNEQVIEELTSLCKAALAWGRKKGYPVVEDYPQYKRARAIGEQIYASAGFQAMKQTEMMVRERIKSRDNPPTFLLEYGWNGIGEWMA